MLRVRLAIHFQQGETGLLLAAFYLVCVLAIVFHFANGLWSAAITWGLTVSRASQSSVGICLCRARHGALDHGRRRYCRLQHS